MKFYSCLRSSKTLERKQTNLDSRKHENHGRSTVHKNQTGGQRWQRRVRSTRIVQLVQTSRSHCWQKRVVANRTLLFLLCFSCIGLRRVSFCVWLFVCLLFHSRRSHKQTRKAKAPLIWKICFVLWMTSTSTLTPIFTTRLTWCALEVSISLIIVACSHVILVLQFDTNKVFN
jgi:hypothetical protein